MNIENNDRGWVFKKLVLHDADFSYAILPECKFDQADLRGARFLDTYLVGTSFRGANLQKSVFTISENFSWSSKKIATEGADWDWAQTRSYDLTKGEYVFSNSGGPIFDFADLTDASLGYAPWYSIAHFGTGDEGQWVLATAPTFEFATLTRTSFLPIATEIAYVRSKPTKAIELTAPFRILFKDLQRRDPNYDYSVLPVIADPDYRGRYVELTLRSRERLIPSEELRLIASTLLHARDWRNAQIPEDLRSELSQEITNERR